MKAFDTVRIAGVRGYGSHGVFDCEKTERHPFVADIDATVDTRAAGESDVIADTVSYADLAQDALAVIEGERVDLIETLAERIAARVLHRGALAVDVTVHKPEAPVGVEFADASVTVRRRGALLESGVIRTVVLCLGSNLGDSAANLDWAIGEIAKLPVFVAAVSDFFVTEPVLAPEQDPQPNYTNAVVVLTTAMAPLDLLAELQTIEVRGGRVRHERWGARTIDIDIVDIEGVVSKNPILTLPHPRAAERLFVLEPWARIDPHARLGGRAITELIEGLKR